MSLSSYTIFVQIVESGSFAGAARELHLSPSAVSKQLSRLEQRLDTKLIQRSTRSVRVTEAGERFYQRCRSILQAVDEAEAEVAELSSQAAGRLRVTLPQSLATAHFASLIAQFQKQHPAITVDLSVSNSIVNLIENRVDIAFPCRGAGGFAPDRDRAVSRKHRALRIPRLSAGARRATVAR